jgi:hypothetical protein
MRSLLGFTALNPSHEPAATTAEFVTMHFSLDSCNENLREERIHRKYAWTTAPLGSLGGAARLSA